MKKQNIGFLILFLAILGLAFRSNDPREVLYHNVDTLKSPEFPKQYLIVLSEDERNQLYQIVRSSGKLTADQAENYINWFQKRCNPMDSKKVQVTKKN